MAVDTQAMNSNEEQFNFSPNTLTTQDYAAIQTELAELEQKLDNSNSEFMFQHYTRLMRAMSVTQEKAAKAKVKLDDRTRREKTKVKREQLQTKREQRQAERLQSKLANKKQK